MPGQLVDQYGQPIASETRSVRSHGREERRRCFVRAAWDAAATTRHNSKHWANADGLGPLASSAQSTREIIRRRARYECIQSNSYAKGIVSTLANDTIGSGPALQMRTGDRDSNKRIERAWNRWCREVHLADKLRLMRRTKCIDGEVFCRLVTNRRLKGPVKLDLVPIEGDLVCDPNHVMSPDPRNADGVILDDLGNPLKYRCLKNHPGDVAMGLAKADFEDVPASQMIHWFNADRPGQKRGVSEIAPALPLFAQLRAFTLAVLDAAERAAMNSSVLQTTSPEISPDDDPENDGEVIDLERGVMTRLPAGWELKQILAAQPAATYEMFKAELLNEIARCLNMPYNIAACNSSKYNYSSGKLDHQIYFRAIGIEQSQIEDDILELIFEMWLREYLAEKSGISPMSIDLDLYHHYWAWDAGEAVDSVKEAQAETIQVNAHHRTIADVCARRKLDWEDVLDQRGIEIAYMRKKKLPIPAAETGVVPQPGEEPVGAGK